MPWGEAALTAPGLRGQRAYTLHAAGGLLTKYRRIGASLAEDTAANAAFLEAESAYNRFAYQHYTAVPDDIRRFLTEKLSGWEREPGQIHFDCQRAKQNILFYLSTYITYTETASAPPAGTDPILYFLDGSQTGGDAQYAAAAAMMFRYYGIPARCVEGFLVTRDAAASMTPGQPLTLTGQSGHTWVEYYQDGVGWLPFEVAPPYLSVMEQAESYRDISGLVGQAPPDTESDEEPDAPDSDLSQTLREFWLKHRLTILLTLSILLTAAVVCLFAGWIIWERKRPPAARRGLPIHTFQPPSTPSSATPWMCCAPRECPSPTAPPPTTPLIWTRICGRRIWRWPPCGSRHASAPHPWTSPSAAAPSICRSRSGRGHGAVRGWAKDCA